MNIFRSPDTFNLAEWEKSKIIDLKPKLDVNTDFTRKNLDLQELAFGDSENYDQNQFIIFQLSAEGENHILPTSKVTPIIKGDSQNKDVNLLIEFDSFKISDSLKIDKSSKATLQLVIGQEKKMEGLDKLFYCINGGLDLYNKIKQKNAAASDFKKSTDAALGNKPISLPNGISNITLKVVKHEEPKWWQSVFDFAKSDPGKELISLTGFGGITESAVNAVSNMLNNLFDDEPEVLFESATLKVAFSQYGKEDLQGGLPINYVSSLNPGYWLMARISDYEEILSLKPIYYSGTGTLAPDGFDEIKALNSKLNPFSDKTYAVIRAKMKEVDLKQNFFL